MRKNNKSTNNNANNNSLPSDDFNEISLDIVRQLKNLKRHCQPFLYPVDPIKEGIPQYLEIIKNPMDLCTVESKINDKKYKSIEETLNDLQLIWDNCKSFNMEESEIYKSAEAMQKRMLNIIKEHNINYKTNQTGLNNSELNINRIGSVYQTNEQESIASEEQLSLMDKIKLSEKVKQMDEVGLSNVVQLISDYMPTAIEDFNDDKIHIRVDVMNKEVYNKVLEYINQYTSTSSHETFETNEPPKKKRKVKHSLI